MNYKQSLMETICKHPVVSRAASGSAQGPAVEKLLKLRRAMRDIKRARRNMREEVGAMGKPSDAYDRGMITVIPQQPGTRLIKEALAIGGLPDDLKSLCEQAVEE